MKKGFVGFWRYYSKEPRSMRVAFMLLMLGWLTDTVAEVFKLYGYAWVNEQLRLCGGIYLTCSLLCIGAYVVSFVRKERQLNREHNEFLRKAEMKLIVLDTLTELMMSKMSPEQKQEAMFKSPSGPKE